MLPEPCKPQGFALGFDQPNQYYQQPTPQKANPMAQPDAQEITVLGIPLGYRGPMGEPVRHAMLACLRKGTGPWAFCVHGRLRQ